MSVFIDASAIVAIIGREPEARVFGERIAWDDVRLTSALAIWEAARALPAKRGIDFGEARQLVADFIQAGSIEVVQIGTEGAELALEAHERFGKGVHEADLNFGDCFAYACTKRHEAEILFKGEDFIHTDLRDAMLP